MVVWEGIGAKGIRKIASSPPHNVCFLIVFGGGLEPSLHQSFETGEARSETSNAFFFFFARSKGQAAFLSLFVVLNSRKQRGKCLL